MMNEVLGITVKKTKENIDGLFGIPPFDSQNPWFWGAPKDHPIWKTRKYYICQTSGMQFWTALTQIQCFACLERRCSNHREHYKAAVLSFPYEVGNCKCKNCRFYRIYKKYV
jgi:hypothetical protein